MLHSCFLAWSRGLATANSSIIFSILLLLLAVSREDDAWKQQGKDEKKNNVLDWCGGRKSAMVRISVLNDALKNMFNAEKRGKRQVLLKPSSKVIIKFLSVMQKHGTFSTSKNLTRSLSLSLSLSELYNHHHHQKQNALHSSSSDAAHEFEAKWV